MSMRLLFVLLYELTGNTVSYKHIIMYDHVIAGDFNIDFVKVSPNRTILECFMQAFDLVRGDICSDISFIYRRDDRQSFS